MSFYFCYSNQTQIILTRHGILQLLPQRCHPVLHLPPSAALFSALNVSKVLRTIHFKALKQRVPRCPRTALLHCCVILHLLLSPANHLSALFLLRLTFSRVLCPSLLPTARPICPRPLSGQTLCQLAADSASPRAEQV